MAYHQYDPEIESPQTYEEYYEKYGLKPGQPGWEYLSNSEREWLKKGRAPYQSYTKEEKDIMAGVHRDITAGSPADISGLEALTERYQMSPAIRQYLIKKVGALFQGGPDYQDVYKAQKGKIDVAMREGERGIMERQAAMGLLDSSATQARLGGLQGGYTGALADLLMGTAQMTETARSNRMREGLGLMGAGLQWQGEDVGRKSALEGLKNALYAQDIGFKAGELDFLGAERGRENVWNLGFAGLPQDEPLTLAGMLPGILQSIPGLIAAFSGGGDYSWLGSLFGQGGSSANIPGTEGFDINTYYDPNLTTIP